MVPTCGACCGVRGEASRSAGGGRCRGAGSQIVDGVREPLRIAVERTPRDEHVGSCGCRTGDRRRPDAAVDRDEEARVIKNLAQLLLRDLAASSFQLRARAATVSAGWRLVAGALLRGAHLGIIGEDKVLGQADLGAVEAHVEDLILAPAAERGVSGAARRSSEAAEQ